MLGDCVTGAELDPTPPPAARSSQGSAGHSQENRAVVTQRGEAWDEVSLPLGPGPAWGPKEVHMLWRCQLEVRGQGSGTSSAAHLLCDLGQVTRPLGLQVLALHSGSAGLSLQRPRQPGIGRSAQLPGYFYRACGQPHHSSWNQNPAGARSPKVMQPDPSWA